ncbi:MAG: MotA/TolQ/ExbB proton channel family protein [Verrucomicrobiia bacterium]|jgi:biopolymer transport protein ExbB/TolQ
MNAVLATGLLYAFQQSDVQGQVIVGILCLGSALTWTVVLTKWQQLRRVRKSGQAFLAQFRHDPDPLHLFINNFEMADCPLYNIYRMGAEEVSSRFGGGRRRGAGQLKPLGGNDGGLALAVETAVAETGQSQVNLDMLRNVLGRAIDAEVIKLESQLPILSTAVQGGPFLGLLGSAWGVMSVFGSMGQQGTVRLGAVAPGICAALLATVVGLFVAIPSLFAFNWLASRVRHQTMELENFADEFIAAVEHNYGAN